MTKPETQDPRYDFVKCPDCGRTWQKIDFGCAPHSTMCDTDKAFAKIAQTSNA